MMFISRALLLFLIPLFSYATPVRVLLDQKKTGTWRLSARRGFRLRDRTTDRELTLKQTRNILTLTCKPDGVYLDNKKLCVDNMLFEPIDGIVQFGSGVYEGAFYLQKDKQRYLLINILPLENYVYSVLKTESWPGWPLEVNKVMAIASRTYLLHRLFSSRIQDNHYHIKNTNYHQTYTGMHDCPVIRQAVHETRDVFLSHEGKPILAMFDSCCGGIAPSSITGMIDFKKAPYLERSYKCHYCRSCKLFTWSALYELDHFIDLLQEGTNTIIHDIKTVKVTQKKAGFVKDIQINTLRGLLAFDSQDFYRLFKEVKSYSFSVKKQGTKIAVNGKGYGHHIGLCQWGAREMVNKGFNYKKILEFYYPKTTFMKLERK
ncbi:MAG: stage II sporulation protein D [Alteromonas naphthalenivorans]|jgi:stage II sporulation protein D